MNGQENDNEIAEGIFTAEYWQYDSRLGRRWNLDPRPQINTSDYACFANNPIFIMDINGDVGEPVAHKDSKGNITSYSLNTTIYLKKGDNVDDKQFADVKASFENVNTVFNGTYQGKTVTANVKVVVVDNKPTNFKPGDNFFEVTTSGETKVNEDRTNGVINVLQNYTKTTVAHEWGHLFGLADRYVQSYYYDDNPKKHNINFDFGARNTVPISNIPDPDYNPYNNLYSSSTGGTTITQQQYGFMFSDKKEDVYTSSIILRSGTADESKTKVIRVANDGVHLTSFPNYASSKNQRANGREEIQASPNGSTSNCEPYNCDHGSKNKKATMQFFLKK